MKFNYDLSILVPGIRNENWEALYEHSTWGCKRYKYEMIFCGPYALPPALQDVKNVKYIKDFGSPARALHLASLVAEGRFMTWFADDAHVYPDSVDCAMDLLLANNPDKDIIGIRYCEGENHSGNEFTHPMHYSYVSTHVDLQAPNVDRNWIAPGVLMLSTEYYRWLGGLDQRYHHANMNVYDLAYRAQRNGSKVILTPFLVMNCNWSPKRNQSNCAVIQSFFENDRPLYWSSYSQPELPPIQLDPENWRDTEVVWTKRQQIKTEIQ